MKHTLRAQSLILAALRAASAMTACGGDTPAGTETTASAGDPAADVTTGAAYPALEVRDLGGKDVNVLIRSEWAYEFVVEEENGDLVNDAIYRRNAAIEERYHCKLNFIDFAGAWGQHTNFGNIIHNSVLAGDGAYDFVAGYQATLPTNTAEGDFLNLHALPHLKLDAPWWTSAGIDALTINGRCYTAGGDIAVSLLEGIFFMFFNKRLAEENKLPDLYQLVRDNKWTHDKLMEVIKNTGKDLDGNAEMALEDSYGFTTSDTYIRPYIVAYNTPTLGYNADGTLKHVWNSERTISVLEDIVDMAYDKDVLFVASTVSNHRQVVADTFRAGRTIIAPSTLGASATLRDMADDFGIIPYPMYDEKQGSYYTTTSNEVTMIAVPITAPDPDKSALIIEAMCRESHDTVASAFYDTALKGKYARDEESLEMIEMIRQSLSFDTGWINSLITDVSGAQYSNMVNANDKAFATWYAGKEASFKERLVTFSEVYYN